MSNLPYVDPLHRLKLTRHVAPQAFDNKIKTPRFHLEGLELIEKRYSFTLLVMFRGASKTTVFNKAYVFTEIFFNKEPFTQIVSKDNNKAKKFVRDIRKLFEAAMMKGYAIAKGAEWSDGYFEVIIDGKHKCVVSAIGAGEDPRGDTADFSRPTLIVVDDLESRLGRYPVHKAKYREKLEEWFYDDLLPGLHPEGRIIFMGTVLHKDSLLAKCMRDKRWHVLNVPIIRDGKSSWGSRFSLEKIEEIKEWFSKRGRLSNFFREYMNKPVADEKVLFKEKYFKYFSHIEYEGESERRQVGNAVEDVSILVRKPKYIVLEDGDKIPLSACEIYTIVDIADPNRTGDRTAMVTCANYEGKRYVLEIKSGYWNPHEKGVYLIETYLTFRPRWVGIEKGPMYGDLVSSIEVLLAKEGIDIPIEGITHGGVAKNTRIANMQPSFVDGRILFNREDVNTSVVEAQLVSFDESADSDEDDEMDALAYHENTNESMLYDYGEDDYEQDGGMYGA